MRHTFTAPLFIFILLFTSGCEIFGPSTDDLGKRTRGTKLNDNRVESLAKKNIRVASAELEKAHINVNSFNGMVLLTGQVPSQDARATAEKIVEDLRNVQSVHNELEIAGPTSMMARANDTWLSTKVKSQLAASEDADAGRIKVITENGVVYMMGLLTRDEAEKAVVIARGVYGVQKIVTAFEYIN